MIDCVLL